MIMIDSNDFRELLALKRVGPIRGSTNANVVLVPEGSGDQDLCIYLLSDAYLGLDQQYDLHLHVEEEVVGVDDVLVEVKEGVREGVVVKVVQEVEGGCEVGV